MKGRFHFSDVHIYCAINGRRKETKIASFSRLDLFWGIYININKKIVKQAPSNCTLTYTINYSTVSIIMTCQWCLESMNALLILSSSSFDEFVDAFFEFIVLWHILDQKVQTALPIEIDKNRYFEQMDVIWYYDT